MTDTITNFKSYVNGYKVVKSDDTTVTLGNGVTIEKRRCYHISTDHRAGITYYRYEEEDSVTEPDNSGLLEGEADVGHGMSMTQRNWASAVLVQVAGATSRGSYPQEISAFDLGRALGRALTNSNESEHLMLLGAEVLRGMQHYKNVKGRHLEKEGTATIPRFRTEEK